MSKQRVIIEHVQPVVDGGIYRAKRTVGEPDELIAIFANLTGLELNSEAFVFIAAGNCAVLKPSEFASATEKLVVKIIEEIFPIIRLAAPWMETEAGHVELLIGLDHKQWLPVHVEDCWNPDDDMRLVRSAFGHTRNNSKSLLGQKGT